MFLVPSMFDLLDTSFALVVLASQAEELMPHAMTFTQRKTVCSVDVL